MTRRQGRRRKKLLDDLKDRRGYPHLKEEALDRSMWRGRFGRGFEPVVRLLDDDIAECRGPVACFAFGRLANLHTTDPLH